MSFDTREKSRYGAQPVECYRFSQGSTLWLMTSADKSIVLPVGTFEPETIQRSELDDSFEDDSGRLEVYVARDNLVAQLFIAGLPATSVSLTIYRAHRGEESDYKARFIGKVGSVRYEGSQAVLICLPLSATLRRRVPSLAFQSLCPWALYGVGCGVSKAAFRDPITLSTVTGVTLVSSGFAARADGWYTNGFIESATGAVMFIVNHVGNTVTLMAPLVGIAAGQVVFAYAGCDRTETTCTSKFNNLVHHLGFSRIPTRNPYDGSIV